jgi:hypothetical protein
MHEYPEHGTMCQAIADFATDGERGRATSAGRSRGSIRRRGNGGAE